jgi:hypothetical protein
LVFQEEKYFKAFFVLYDGEKKKELRKNISSFFSSSSLL